MADVFVSYSRKNRDRVARGQRRARAGRLQRCGGTGSSRPATITAMLIEREIDAAALRAWSPGRQTARQSLWVRAEANEALDAGKLVQVSLDETKLPLPFTMLHFLDFSRWGGERQGAPWTELDSRVGACCAASRSRRRLASGRRRAGPALQGLGPGRPCSAGRRSWSPP